MNSHRLDAFHRRCLRAILGISWRDHATSTACDNGRSGVNGRHKATIRSCHNKETRNGWPHPPVAERKSRTFNNVGPTGCQKTAE